MPESSSSEPPSAFLICDRKLGKLLREINNDTKDATRRIKQDPLPKVDDLLSKIRSLESSYEFESESFFKESLSNLKAEIEKKRELMKESNVKGVRSTANSISSLGDDALKEMMRKYTRVDNEEQLLLRIFTLLPENALLTKKDIFHLFISLKNDSTSEYESELEVVEVKMKNLVKEGLIRIIARNHLSIKYRMHHSFRSQIILNDRERRRPEGPVKFDIVNFGDRRAVTCINNESLEMSSSDELRDELMKADVVILGSWWQQKQRDDDFGNEYMAMDTTFLDVACHDNMPRVRYLGLRGAAGITRLPDSVSHLASKLQILDLKAFNDLESLPKQIGSLIYLTSLDLSECYFLDHIPSAIVLLSKLRVLKGFIIHNDDMVPNTQVNQRKRSSISISNCKKIMSASPSRSPSCPFSELHHLKYLQKLTLRTRRMNFPNIEDLGTLCQLENLCNLGITWVKENPSRITPNEDINLQGSSFPNKVEKLEIQSAPHPTIASQLLELAAKQHDSKLKKLYIRGGHLKQLSPEKHCFPHVEVVRLRYLHKFDMKWDHFKESFPSLVWLEVYECPLITSFPTNKSEIWEANSDC